MLRALGVVGTGAFDLSGIAVPVIDLTRFIPGLAAPVSPVLSTADSGLGPGITDTSELWMGYASPSIPLLAGQTAAFAMNATDATALGATQVDLLYFSAKCSVGPVTLNVGVLRGQGTLGTTGFTQQRITGAGLSSVHWKYGTLTAAGSFFAGAPNGIMHRVSNLPAATLYEYPFSKPALSMLPPFALGDGFVLAFENAAATGGLCDFTCIFRIRGLGTGA